VQGTIANIRGLLSIHHLCRGFASAVARPHASSVAFVATKAGRVAPLTLICPVAVPLLRWYSGSEWQPEIPDVFRLDAGPAAFPRDLYAVRRWTLLRRVP
jgi:hypothetical protein